MLNIFENAVRNMRIEFAYQGVITKMVLCVAVDQMYGELLQFVNVIQFLYLAWYEFV